MFETFQVPLLMNYFYLLSCQNIRCNGLKVFEGKIFPNQNSFFAQLKNLVMKSLNGLIQLCHISGEDCYETQNLSKFSLKFIFSEDIFNAKLIKGPEGNSDEVSYFKLLWGETVHVRRFKDGSILAVKDFIDDYNNDRMQLPKKIISKLLQK